MTYMAKIPRPIGRTVVNTLVQLVTMLVKEVLIAAITAVPVSVLIFHYSFPKNLCYGLWAVIKNNGINSPDDIPKERKESRQPKTS